MDTNKMRTEFLRSYRRLLTAEGMMIQESRFVLRDGEFVHRETAIAWWAWQASREAVVVELPETPNRGIGYRLFDAGKEACREAIEAQGLKVTP